MSLFKDDHANPLNTGLGYRHPVQNWEDADAAARDARTYVADDVGREVKLADTTFWRVVSVSGGAATFREVAGNTIAALLTGFTAGAGTVSATDSILQALQKIVGNIAAISAITASSADTLTNKRITNRVGSTTSSATPAINTDNVDVYKLTAQAVDITSFTTNLTGTPTDTQFLELIITGTAARAIAWGASFISSTILLPTTTVSTTSLRVTLQYDAALSQWVCVGVA